MSELSISMQDIKGITLKLLQLEKQNQNSHMLRKTDMIIKIKSIIKAEVDKLGTK